MKEKDTMNPAGLEERDRILVLLNKPNRSGDDNRLLFEYFWRRSGYYRHKYKNISDSEWMEVVSDSIIKVMRRSNGSRNMTSVSLYFSRSIYYTFIDSYRKNKKHSSNEELAPERQYGELENSEDPSYLKVEDNQALDMAIKSLATLKGIRHVTVFRLRALDGMTSQEVAEKLKISKGNVDVIYSRSCAFLRKEVARLISVEGG